MNASSILAVPVVSAVALLSWSPPETDPVAEPPASTGTDVPTGPIWTRIHLNMPVQPFERFVQDSDEIVRGVVTDQRQVFPTDGSLPYTEFDLWIVSAARGESQRMLPVRVGGAKDGERHVEVVGAPTFFPGEEVLLFLMRFEDADTGAPFFGIRGLEQGTYRLPPDATAPRGVRGLYAAGEQDLVELEARIRAMDSRSHLRSEERPR